MQSADAYSRRLPHPIAWIPDLKHCAMPQYFSRPGSSFFRMGDSADCARAIPERWHNDKPLRYFQAEHDARLPGSQGIF